MMALYGDELMKVLGYAPSDDAMEEYLYKQDRDPVSPESEAEWQSWRELIPKGEIVRKLCHWYESIRSKAEHHYQNARDYEEEGDRNAALNEAFQGRLYEGWYTGIAESMEAIIGSQPRAEVKRFPWATWNALARKP